MMMTAHDLLWSPQPGLQAALVTCPVEDMLSEEHYAAFTVAKMMNRDLLSFVAKKTQQAIGCGQTLAAFKQQLIPSLQKGGWWRNQDLAAPNTGKIVNAQPGSASRLAIIFRTNLQSAYSVGHWQGIRANAATAPFLMYDAVDIRQFISIRLFNFELPRPMLRRSLNERARPSAGSMGERRVQL